MSLCISLRLLVSLYASFSDNLFVSLCIRYVCTRIYMYAMYSYTCKCRVRINKACTVFLSTIDLHVHLFFTIIHYCAYIINHSLHESNLIMSQSVLEFL